MSKNIVNDKPISKIETKIVSFRLPVNIINQIRAEAKNNKISLNSIVSNVLMKYIQWDTHTKEMEMISVPKFVLEQLSDAAQIESINKLTESFHEYVKEWIVFTKGEYEFKQCMEFLVNYMNTSGFATSYIIKEFTHRFTIRHKLGMNWSIIFEDVIKKIFNDFVPGKKFKISITPSSVKSSITLDDNFHINTKYQ